MSLQAYISALAYYLPEKTEDNELNRLTKKTGIYHRHIATENECASDLALKAAEKLFSNNMIEKESIDFLLLCTQSPDYVLPTTACILQDKLGLPKTIGAFDFNLGCSGYIYGISMAQGLIETGQARNVLLLTAETYSKYINRQDNTVRPLFGDAATATLITGKESESKGIKGITFGTDGSGYKNLIVPMGAQKVHYDESLIKEEQDKYGNVRTNANLYMNGAAISNFALEVVPDMLVAILNKCKMSKEDIDYYVFHQANKFILKFLQEKCGLLDQPYWNDVSNYGNTVSNSIPIALVDMMAVSKAKVCNNVMVLGFGVGLSWAGCILDLSEIKKLKKV
ncbi:3-oxoacyl-ACP synthase III family protein [Propionispira raffinosivorans]|uniref:3-oxoacyl-ACP synthase III family protein n=1 Tax=Propionispira raffinosivorans TaxID=86959 RepID=UPI0003796BA5|nr:ketoacyl-ACP synthase III [Propionispira raffinosivorans]